MFKFDNKGQSSSVFNLLIAALVSLAILGLLLSIMGVIDIGGSGQNPSSIAVTKVKDASQSPYAPQTDTVTFTGKYKNINATAIAQKTDVGADAMFFANCASDAQSSFEGSTEKSFNYSGSSNKKYTLSVICGERIENLTQYGLKDCPLPSSDTSDGLKCYLILYNFSG